MSDLAISVSELSKLYRIGLRKSTSFRESIGNWFKRDEAEYFLALNNVNFEVKKGEALGIIGKNGAGKSTLLKVLSKITYPTKGRIEINGRVSSLLEVGTGFHPELTGRQNIFLNGTILGMSRNEVQSKFDEIIAFSGVEKFIDTPIKRYSSGMKVRLAFSVAAHLEPEILIIDEVLAVGDADFQKRCLGKMEEVTGQGRTVLFVSHNMGAVHKLCNSGIVLENGVISYLGEASQAIRFYLESLNDINNDIQLTSRSQNILKMGLTINGKKTNEIVLKPDENRLDILINGETKNEVQPYVDVRFYDTNQNCLALYTPKFRKTSFKSYTKKFVVNEKIELPQLNKGNFLAEIHLMDGLTKNCIASSDNLIKIYADGFVNASGHTYLSRNNGWILLS